MRARERQRATTRERSCVALSLSLSYLVRVCAIASSSSDAAAYGGVSHEAAFTRHALDGRGACRAVVGGADRRQCSLSRWQTDATAPQHRRASWLSLGRRTDAEAEARRDARIAAEHWSHERVAAVRSGRERERHRGLGQRTLHGAHGSLDSHGMERQWRLRGPRCTSAVWLVAVVLVPIDVIGPLIDGATSLDRWASLSRVCVWACRPWHSSID